MLTMPKQVEYALMVLGEMQAGEEGQLFPVRAICEKLGVPFDVVSKAMQGMNHAGILKSVQGKYGGYQVIKNLSTVSVEEMMVAVVGPNAVAACLQPGHVCRHAESCTIRLAVSRLDKEVRGLFGRLTIADLIA